MQVPELFQIVQKFRNIEKFGSVFQYDAIKMAVGKVKGEIWNFPGS